MVAFEDFVNITKRTGTVENLTEYYRSNEPYTVPITVVLRTVGAVTFMLNLFVFIYIIRLCKRQKRENSFYIQLAFICANDIGCGLFIVLMSIPVTDVINVYICGFSFIVLNGLTCMAQGNIFFICLQRYVFSRNIRSTSIKWKALLSKTLLAVNSIIGVVVLAVNLSFPLYEGYRGNECTLAVYKNYGRQTVLMLFYIGLPTMLASDVLCFLAILNLSSSSAVTPACISSNGTGSSDQVTSAEANSVNFKRNQKRAIKTIILILIALNLSEAPSFLNIFLFHFNVSFGLQINRLFIFSIYGNSLANPVIYITRIQELRSMVIKDFSKLKLKR